MDERNRVGQKAGLAGIICNILLASGKLTVGLASGAVSIVADAINNFSDALSSMANLIGFRLAAKPADDEHPFGHARYEYISAFTVAFIILAAGKELFTAGIDKLRSGGSVEFSAAMVIVLIVSILVKAGMAFFNLHLSRKYDSLSLKATAEDSRNDVIATSAVLLSLLLSHYTGLELDGVMSILVAVFILYSGVMLLGDTIVPLLGTAPDPAYVKEIEDRIMSYPVVMGTHDLMVHDYGPGRRFASCHVEMPAEENVIKCHEIIDNIERDFHKSMGLHMVIHYDPIVSSDEAVGGLRQYLKEKVKELNPKITIHDLRIIPGEGHTNVVFDCVVPHDVGIDNADIKARISSMLQEKYPNHIAVMKIEHSFVSLDED